MFSKRFCVLLISMLCVFSLVIGGCAPAKKPPNPVSPPAENNLKTPAPSPTPTVTESRATRIAQACDKVSGVKESTVVISGNTAYVGLDIAANVEKEKTNSIEKECIKKAKSADTATKTVLVTSDADTVTRLKKIYQGIKEGKPISSFSRELTEISRRITPKIE
ncbi:MAG: YhcN/YlaJ family sporulation lipoprotein [Bacillota bacterium]|jgi:YhcN/YlaJ family sporulation lipoprotein